MMLYLYSDSNIRNRTTQAFTAAEKGDIKKLTRLLNQKLDIDARGPRQETLLMKARDPATVAWLIEHRANLNLVDDQGNTVLADAALGKQIEKVKQLIAAKANLNIRDQSGETALNAADRAGNEEIAALLRAAGADDDVISADTGEPLPEDGGPQLAAIKEYLAAIHARDGGRLRW